MVQKGDQFMPNNEHSCIPDEAFILKKEIGNAIKIQSNAEPCKSAKDIVFDVLKDADKDLHVLPTVQSLTRFETLNS